MPDPVTGVTAGATLVGGAMGSRASEKASQAQERATDAALALKREMYEKDIELQEPFRQAGMAGQNELMRLLGIGGDATRAGYGELARPFGMEQFQVEPGYGFRLSEGMKALDRTAAARGGLLSGATLKGAQRFGQNLASEEWQNAFNRYQIERAARLAPLQSLFGAGQTTAQQMGQAGQQFGQMAGEDMLGGANARASGYVGAANAWNQALGGATNLYMQNALMNRMFTPPAPELEYFTPTASRRVGTAPGGR